jgi:8-oxo-dGTP diphosphatase
MELLERSKYALTVDCVVFGYDHGTLKVVLIERKNDPFKGSWALPGGFVEDDETVEQAAARELQEETGVHDIYLEQFHVFSNPERDPRGRVITVAHFALINSDHVELIATQDALRAQWFDAYDIPKLAFDHKQIYLQALEALRRSVSVKPLVFELLPKYFTLTMLQQLYEQIFGKVLDKRNFRKQVADMDYVQETQKMTKGGQHRPARLYKFDAKRYSKHQK